MLELTLVAMMGPLKVDYLVDSLAGGMAAQKAVKKVVKMDE